MIKLEKVTKSFNQKIAVEDISFQVNEGETLVLLGMSGCGKTTTLRMINRLLETDSGTISVNGKNIKEQSPEILRRGIGYVLQDNGLFPHYTVAENIAIVPKLLRWNKEQIYKRSTQLLEKLKLSPDLLKAYPAQLSGGQQQRVGLARALMANPPVLLMDEPLGALDPITRINIRKEFKNLDELKRKTIILVTHDVNEAFDLADRICLMSNGKIHQIGTPESLLLHPQDDFVKEFLNEHKLQLEFKTITLSELWPYLPIQEHSGETKSLSPESSLWDAFTLLLDENNTVNISNELTGKIKKVSFNDLMISFKSYKQKE
ncbi:MAG TPA: ABC transporter ATP-binding protein [Daejeonella sp.]|nr:ABC transporter ATP-binding protein [Daejeonella sp.]